MGDREGMNDKFETNGNLCGHKTVGAEMAHTFRTRITEERKRAKTIIMNPDAKTSTTCCALVAA